MNAAGFAWCTNRWMVQQTNSELDLWSAIHERLTYKRCWEENILLTALRNTVDLGKPLGILRCPNFKTPGLFGEVSLTKYQRYLRFELLYY